MLNIKQIRTYEAQLRENRDDKRLKQAFYQTCDNLFMNYDMASIDDRVDIHLAFDSRPALLNALTGYVANLIDRVENTDGQDQRLLKCAVCVDSMFEGRPVTNEYRHVQNRLLQFSEEFDVIGYAQKVQLSAKNFASRAKKLHEAGDRANAVKALGRAIELQPELQHHEKVVDLAVKITKLSPEAAIETLTDDAHRKAFVGQFEKAPPVMPDLTPRRQSVFDWLGVSAGSLITGTVVFIGLCGLLFMFFQQLFMTDLLKDLEAVGVSSTLQKPDNLKALIGVGVVQMLGGVWLVFTRHFALYLNEFRITLFGSGAFVTGIGLLCAGGVVIITALIEFNVIEFSLTDKELMVAYATGVGMSLPAIISGFMASMFDPSDSISAEIYRSHHSAHLDLN